MVMNLFRSKIATELEPYAMQHIDLFRGQPRRVWTKIEDVLLPAGEVDF